MPIYSYVCKDCGHKFDLLVGIISEKPKFKCEKCSSKNIERLFGSFNVGSSGNKTGFSGDSCPTGTCPTSF